MSAESTSKRSLYPEAIPPTSAELIAMKDTLRLDLILRANVCARMALDAVFTCDYGSISEGLIIAPTQHIEPHQLVYAAATEAAGKADVLAAALQLPGDQWSAEATDTAIVHEAYKRTLEFLENYPNQNDQEY
jgi:hypothetical protein